MAAPGSKSAQTVQPGPGRRACGWTFWIASDTAHPVDQDAATFHGVIITDTPSRALSSHFLLSSPPLLPAQHKT
jgi:hypothetical protein